MITLTINGQPREFSQPLAVSELLTLLELTGKRLAVECNGEIVSHSGFDCRLLQHGDNLEIVVAVGGG